MPIQFTWAEVFHFYENSQLKELLISEIGQVFGSLPEIAQRRELKHASPEMLEHLIKFTHPSIQKEYEDENFWRKRLSQS